MLVSSELAQSIVEETEKVIKLNVNFMNSDAKIIASIDRERIGDFHEGALEVIKTKKKVVIKKDSQLKGVKAGVNLPVYFKEHIVGVIGITGSEVEVGQMGEVIQKMTEILVKEAYLDQQLGLEQQAKGAYIDEWISGRWESDKLFASRGWFMEINVYLPRIVLVFDLKNFSELVYEHLKNNQLDVRGELEVQRIRQNILQTVKTYYENQKDALIVITGSSRYTVLLPVNPNEPINKQKEQIRYQIGQVQKLIFEKHGYEVDCGVSRYHEGLIGITKSFKEADRAISFGRTSEKQTIRFYDEMGLESIIGEISKETRDDFIERTLKLNEIQKKEQLLETLQVFFQCNQSINDAANKLYIHKNTLQYRLKKVKELTGNDPRILEQAVLLYVAFVMNEIGEK